MQRWTDGIFRNGHGIFMPFLMGYLIWDQLKQDSDPEPRSSPLGWLFLGGALVLLVLDSAIHSELLAAAAFVISLPGIALLTLGARRTRMIALPLAIGIFMLPIPAGAIAQLYLVLRKITAIATSQLVPLFGVPLARDGTMLTLPRSLVDVADNCSGFATMYAAILSSIVLAHLARTPVRKAAVLLAAVPLALVCNFARVTVLVLLVHVYGSHVLETEIHPLSGMLLFVLVIGALLAIAGRDALRAQPGTVRAPVSDRYATAMLVACGLALVPIVAHSYLRVRSDDCANPGALVPPMVNTDDVAARDARVRHDFVDVYQWREGKLAPANGSPELSYVVIRSYDPKVLYYRGTRRMWSDVSPHGDSIEWLETGEGALPVVRSTVELANPRGTKALVAALLVYEGSPVEKGWLAQLRAAPRELFTGARPMTFFAVRGDVPEPLLPAAEVRARQWLLDSWRNYRAICGG